MGTQASGPAPPLLKRSRETCPPLLKWSRETCHTGSHIRRQRGAIKAVFFPAFILSLHKPNALCPTLDLRWGISVGVTTKPPLTSTGCRLEVTCPVLAPARVETGTNLTHFQIALGKDSTVQVESLSFCPSARQLGRLHDGGAHTAIHSKRGWETFLVAY